MINITIDGLKMIIINNLVGGWPTPLKKNEFISWDYDIPNWVESHKIPWFQTTKQLSHWLIYSWFTH